MKNFFNGYFVWHKGYLEIFSSERIITMACFPFPRNSLRFGAFGGYDEIYA